MVNGLPCSTPIPCLGTAFPRRETTSLRDDVEGIGGEGENMHEDVVVGMGVIGDEGGLNLAAQLTKESVMSSLTTAFLSRSHINTRETNLRGLSSFSSQARMSTATTALYCL